MMKVYPLRSAVVVASVPFKPTVVHLTSVTFVKSFHWPPEESVHLMSVVDLMNAVHLPSVVPLRRVLFPVASVVLLTKVVPFSCCLPDKC